MQSTQGYRAYRIKLCGRNWGMHNTEPTHFGVLDLLRAELAGLTSARSTVIGKALAFSARKYPSFLNAHAQNCAHNRQDKQLIPLKGLWGVLNTRVFMSWAELPKWIIVFYVLCTVSSQDTDTGHARNVSADLSFCLTFPSMPSTSFQTGLQDNSCFCLPNTWPLTQSLRLFS